MNDFDYDVMQKKRIARGSYNRKRGSKSKKCSLPSDRLTPKQWKEKNGKVMVYEMNKSLSYKEFTTYPKEHQAAYIRGLKEKYDIRLKDIAEMFGCGLSVVYRLSKELGLKDIFPRGGDRSEQAAERIRKNWDAFICGDDVSFEAPILLPQCASDESVPEEVSAPPVGEKGYAGDDPGPCYTDMYYKDKGMSMREFSLCFKGKIDAGSISNTLRLMIGDDENWTLEIKGTLV